MKFITVATHKTPDFEIFEHSARYHNIDVDVIGLGKKYTGHPCKSRWVCEYLSKLEPDEIVFYTDSYDAFFLVGEKEIDMKFKEFNHPLVFSTEQNFNQHGPFFKRLSVYGKLPKAKKPYQFLNSGGWIGRAAYTRRILEKAFELEKPEWREGDQSYINRYYSEHHDAFCLDDEHKIFTCTAGRMGLEEQDYFPEKDRVINTNTDTEPCIIHFAGKNFTGANKILSHISYLNSLTYTSKISKNYKWYKLKNSLVDKTCQDNYLFHLVTDFLFLPLLVILGFCLLLYYLL